MGVHVCVSVQLIFVLRCLLEPRLLVLSLTAALGPQRCFSLLTRPSLVVQVFSFGVLPDESSQLVLSTSGLYPGVTGQDMGGPRPLPVASSGC